MWLFTYSDMKTVLVPETAFGVVSALSGAVLTANQSPDLLTTLRRVPIVALWVWINLLPFDIENQRQPDSVKEDGEDKPWRVIPSGRLSPNQARNLMMLLYPAAVITSVYTGGLRECLILIFLGIWYNSLGGSENCLEKNFLNGCGFTAFGVGATKVACGSTILDNTFRPAAHGWFLVIAVVIATSCHLQDLPDKAGDALRGRRTMPLVLGDSLARWIAAAAVALWSYVCPAFWQLGRLSHAVCLSAGVTIIFRTLTMRTVRADQITFYVWNLWMVMFYLLPLLKRFQGESLWL